MKLMRRGMETVRARRSRKEKKGRMARSERWRWGRGHLLGRLMGAVAEPLRPLARPAAAFQTPKSSPSA